VVHPVLESAKALRSLEHRLELRHPLARLRMVPTVLSHSDTQKQQSVRRQLVQRCIDNGVDRAIKRTGDGAKAGAVLVKRALLQLPAVFIPQMAGCNIAKQADGIHVLQGCNHSIN